MSKHTQVREIELEEQYDDDISDDDYVFILGSDGELKQVILPENVPFKAPKNVNKILKVFGVHDVSNIDLDATMH
jgi:hypothetical protein